MREKIQKGRKYNDYTVISNPFIDEKGRRVVKIQCKCGYQKICNCTCLHLSIRCKYCRGKNKRIFKIGQKINKLTVIKYIKTKTNQPKVKVKCDCGNILEINAHKLRYQVGCNRCQKTYGINNKKYKGTKFVSKTYYTSIKNGASHRNIDFQLSINDLNDLLIQQNHRCALTKLPIKIGNKIEPTTASVDRINTKVGYIKTNIQWVHKHVNKMKIDFNQEYFIELCKLIAQNN